MPHSGLKPKNENDPKEEEDLRWKMTFDRVLYYLKKILRLLTLTATAQLTPNQRSYQLSKQEIESHMIKEMYTALRKRTCEEKKTTFDGRRLFLTQFFFTKISKGILSFT